MARKRGKSEAKLEEAVHLLAHDSIVTNESLRHKYRPHQLKGTYKPAWEIHIEGDFLLVYYKFTDKDTGERCLELQRLGTHADLFRGY